jgi:hypothetical protein
MGREVAEETEAESSPATRHVNFAHSWLDELVGRKLGNPKSFGRSSVTLVWKAGEIDLVEVQDTVTHK